MKDILEHIIEENFKEAGKISIKSNSNSIQNKVIHGSARELLHLSRLCIYETQYGN